MWHTEPANLMLTAAHSWATRILLAFVVAVSPACSHANPVPAPQPHVLDYSLQWERLSLCIADSVLEVSGLFAFATRFPGTEAGVFFPFIQDSTMGKPELMEFACSCESSNRRPVGLRSVEDHWAWLMRFGDERRCEVRLRYRQVLKSRQASYLLTSVSQWKTPPDSISVDLLYPGAMPAPTINLPMRVTSSGSGLKTYSIRYHEKFPKEDLVVRW